MRVILWCFFVTLVTFAQSERGSITGTVSDPAKAVIPGVVVVATSTDGRRTSGPTGSSPWNAPPGWAT